jgi:hypothetical protein
MNSGTKVKIKAGRFSGEFGEILQPPDDWNEDYEIKVKTGEQRGKKILLMREEFEPDYSRDLGDSVK